MAKDKMLILRFSALGDVAMTVPAVYSLARQYPELDIYMATTPFFARLFINPPANVTVLPFDVKKEYRGVLGTFKLMRRLAAIKPDMVADLHNVGRSWAIDFWMRLHGVKVHMVDKMRSGRDKVLKGKIAQRNFVDRYADVFASLGYPIKLDFKTLFPEGKPAIPLTVNHPAVGLAPFARYYNKTYPLDKMKRVADALTEQGVNVYLFGARGSEAEQLGAWTPFNKRIHSLAGRFSLEEELAIMANMDVMVSMDSANQHMGSLAGVPVVSLWGSTTPACGFMGYGQSAYNALVAGIECQPCSIAGKPECPLGHLDCFGALSPEMIVSKIMSIIQKQG